MLWASTESEIVYGFSSDGLAKGEPSRVLMKAGFRVSEAKNKSVGGDFVGRNISDSRGSL